MKEIAVGSLVLDFSIYPRAEVDLQHVRYIKEAIVAGVVLPPIVAQEDTLRVADGFHRVKAYSGLYGPSHPVQVIEKHYETEADLLADAIRYNASHGRTLSRFDRVHCILLAEQFHLSMEATAEAMGMTVASLGELRVKRVATTMVAGDLQTIPIKRTIRHKAGEELTTAQANANEHLSGMDARFHIEQLIMLIENDLLNTTDDAMLSRLGVLRKLIAGIKKSASA